MARRPNSAPTSAAKTRGNRRSAAASEPEPLPQIPAATGRHRDILETAMELIAERGYHGASLRELARRVGMQQPSLYHYFRTKEEMVEQIIVTFYGDMAAGGAELMDAELEQIPRLVARYVKRLYESRTHPLFVRCMFSIARLNPRFGRLNRAIFVADVTVKASLGLRRFIDRGELTETEAVDLTRLMTFSTGFRLMEEKVLFDERPLGPDVDRYLEFCAAACELWIRELKRRKGIPGGAT
ncbi:TetR/AcrR family transcriptional regulator [Nannocystis radixulma]|uniref:Helix-turn-helix domain containing protein n=1 Tax=Nannocystis radixulma TaxID=2995305 RepID=A0ABT5AZF8_9BACT|nr:TetR/AcrR family transcriptional regulator [Nannocystis radixulma]MDC0666835.1 helix-turn-helix domain containing protein [Nannocystis radixulma]